MKNNSTLSSAKYLGRWTQLSFYYNAIQNHYVNDRRAWKLDQVKVMHYVKYKPWATTDKEKIEELKPVHTWWWNAYDKLPSNQKLSLNKYNDSNKW